MVQLSDEQVVEILRVGREIAFDRVWMAPGSTVFGKTVQWFGDAVGRTQPGATAEVDGRIDDLDGLGDPAAREVLLHMAERTDRLTDRNVGRWQVTTASGGCTARPGREEPAGDYALVPLAGLRRNGETPPTGYRGWQLAQPETLLLYVRRAGIPTGRSPTRVVSTERLDEG